MTLPQYIVLALGIIFLILSHKPLRGRTPRRTRRH